VAGLENKVVIHNFNRVFHKLFGLIPGVALTRAVCLALALAPVVSGEAWPRHVIDDSSKGADGVRLADVNKDGLPDIATAWEEGGVVRIYINPGPFEARRRWPSATVGRVASPEDAVFADLDGNGVFDVVSSCEGAEQTVYVHWAPRHPDDYLKGERWRTEPLPASRHAAQWMYMLPMELDFRRGIDLIGGAKGNNAAIGWFESAAHARGLSGWRWLELRPSGWIMSLIASDMDGDGDEDVLASDRRGPASGAFWLENPGPGPNLEKRWREHRIGASGKEVMFAAEGDVDDDGLRDVLAAVRPHSIYYFRRMSRDGGAWETTEIAVPEGSGTVKAVGVGDMDLDGKRDIVFSCERAEGSLAGVMYLSYRDSLTDSEWRSHDISGPEGVKFDRVELLDLDDDGDLDVLTCEERAGLGVVWYENPKR